ncbi:MAG: sugar phosphate isomerase/epimerase family protein [Candidatus Hydrothermarchaeaceae archaeon]
MKVGFFTNAFKNFSLVYALDSLAELGYGGIELWCKGQHITPYDEDKRVDLIKEQLSERGLEIYALSAHLDFITPSDELRAANIEKFKSVMDIAREFDVKRVVTASGYLEEVPPLERRGMDGRFFDSMVALGEYAKSKKMIIALEPEPEKFLRTPSQAVEIIEEIGIPVFRTVCDMSHAIALNMTPVEFIREMEEYLGHIHLDDAVYGQHPHRHLIPGDGEVDYKEVFSYLKDISYGDWISVELNQHTEKPKEAAMKAVDHLRREGLI